MKILILLLLTILSCRTLEIRNPVSIYISYDDESVFVKENVCHELFSFKKEFQKKFPKSKIYHYILPKINMVIEFELRYLNKIFNSDPKENREIIHKYYMEIENMFPELEKTLDLTSERPAITLTLPQCKNEYPKNIDQKIQNLSIEYKGHRVRISNFVRIQISPENAPELHEKYQIELKIFLNNASVSEIEIKKYLKQIKTLDHYTHEIKILQ